MTEQPGEFTPGPWNSKKWFADKNVLRIVDENDNTIAILYPGEDVKTNEANARLITAAPEIIDALSKTCNILNSEGKCYLHDLPQGSFKCAECPINAAFIKALSVKKKKKG